MKHKKKDLLGPARRMARFISDVVSAATVSPRRIKKYTAIRCLRRPGHKACPGHIIVCEQLDGIIEWKCSSCGTSGVIHGWKGGWSDLSDIRDDSEPPYFELVLNEQQYEELKECTATDSDCDYIIYDAIAGKQGITLRASDSNMILLKTYLEDKIGKRGNLNRRILLEILTGLNVLLGQWNSG